MRRFAYANIWFWTMQAPAVAWWDIARPASFQRWGVLYLAIISILALTLSSLAWYQSLCVGDDALTIDEVVAETTIERADPTAGTG